MKIKKVIAILCVALMLTACADVPEKLQSRDSELESMEQAELSEPARGDLDYIRSCIDEDASKKYGTITVKHASAGTAAEMPVYKVEVGGGDYTVKELAQYLYGDKYDLEDQSKYDILPWNFNGAEPQKNTDKYTPEIDYIPFAIYYQVDTYTPSEDDATRSVHVFSNGTCWGAQAGLYEYGDDYDAPWLGKIKEHYYPEYDDISAVSYKMYDGTEWSLADAVKFTEDFWNDELTKNDPQKFRYKVWRVEVIDLPTNDNYGYLFMMSYEDEAGNRYDCDCYDNFALMDDRVYVGKRFFVGQNQWQLSLKKDEITRFDKAFSFEKSDTESSEKEMLTLGGAMTVLQNELAEYIDHDFETAELCYIVTCDKYPDKDYGGVLKYSPYYCTKFCETVIRPYWCFRTTNGMIDNWNTTENYYVDAVTGEIIHIKLGSE